LGVGCEKEEKSDDKSPHSKGRLQSEARCGVIRNDKNLRG
jgi:hypothetical protein